MTAWAEDPRTPADEADVQYGRHFHVGIVVADLDAAKKELTRAIGVRWRPERCGTRQIRLRHEVRALTMRLNYSVEGPPFIELIEAVPGTLWELAGHGHAHHLGFWSDDLRRESDRLTNLGLQLIASDAAPAGGFEVFAYHRAVAGPYLELVSSALRAEFADHL